MNEIKIIVAGAEIDLAKGIGFGLNFAIDDVKKIESKNSNYSKTITLAGSDNNNKILGGLFDVNADFTFFNPNFKTEAKIIVNSSTVIDGFLQLKSIEKDTSNYQEGNLIVYKCIISSKTADFSTEIKDKKLEDLDFSRFDHEYSRDNIFNSWNNTSADVYVYPLMYKNSDDYGTQDFKPSIFHKAYLKRIAQESGFTLGGSLMDETTEEGSYYAKEIIPFNGELPTITGEEYERRLFKASSTIDNTIQSKTIETTAPLSEFQGFEKVDTDVDIFDNDSTGGNFDNDNHWNTVTNEYTLDVNGSFNLQLSVEHNITYTTASVEAYMSTFAINSDGSPRGRIFNNNYNFKLHYRFYKNGIGLGSPSTENLRAANVLSGSTFNAANSYEVVQNFTTLLDVPNLNLKDTDVITIKYFIDDNNVSGNFLNDRYLQYSLESSGTTVTDVPVTYTMETVFSANTFVKNSTNSGVLTDGSQIILSDFIPKDVKQSDLIKDLVTRCNAYISVDPDNDRKIIIDTREAYYLKGDTLDWSDKKDYSSKTDIKLLSELQNKEFIFSYKSDKDEWNEDYTDSTSGDIYGLQKVEFDNEFVKGTKKIESPFSPTPLIYNSPSQVAIIPAINSGAPKTNLRVLYYGGLIDCLNGKSWNYSSWASGSITTTSQTTYPYAGHFDNPINPTVDINFGELPSNPYYSNQIESTNGTLFNRFWSSYIQQIGEGKLSSMYMNLNEVDISYIRHNLNAKIYVNDSYYYINKIVDYNPLVKGVTKVEFLKINEGVAFFSLIKNKNNLSNQFEKEMKTPRDGGAGVYDNYDGSVNSNITGLNNTISEGADLTTIVGNNNSVGADSSNSIIYGNDNVIAAGVENAYIIGSDNKTITESGTSYIGEVEYKDGIPLNTSTYKVYTALLEQTGTNAPVPTVLENTLGDITFTYQGVGQYSCDSAGLFTENKTTILLSVGQIGGTSQVEWLSDSQLETSPVNILNVNPDNYLKNVHSYIEIRVYN